MIKTMCKFKIQIILINAVKIYQRFAPTYIRKSCRFTPSCSNYMIHSIEIYGVIYGVAKGVKRLLRCYPPNSGVDEP